MRAAFSFVLLLILCFRASAFTVGTQNLYHYLTKLDERKAHMDAELKQFGPPDIIGFQEAARWKQRTSLYEYFRSVTNFNGVYQATNSFGIMNDGVALLTSLPATEMNSEFLPDTPIYSRQAFNSLVVEVEPGRKVLVLSVHLSPSSKNKARRVVQAKAVVDYVNKSILAGKKYPVIIVGDLNDNYDSDALKVFRAAGFADVLGGQPATYDPTSNPLADKSYQPIRFDYILYRPEQLTLLNAGLMFKDNWVSDHYGLRAEFK